MENQNQQAMPQQIQPNPTRPAPLPVVDSAASPIVLEVIGLTKQYPKRPQPAVSDISFQLRKNQFHVFIGANGAGKTTTIKAIVGAYADWKGKILIHGIDNRKAVAKQKIGYIPEHPAFPKKLPARAYLIEMALMSGIAKGGAIAFADKTLADLNMQNLANKSPWSFSSGQQKKILLAQALVHDPDILIMDEPAANLDPIARAEFYAIASQLLIRGKTIFLSSHILAEIGRYANHVTILDGGKIVYSGAHRPGDDMEKLYFQHVQRGSVDTGIAGYDGVPGYPPYPASPYGQPGQYPPYPAIVSGEPAAQPQVTWPNPSAPAVQPAPDASMPAAPKVDSAPQPSNSERKEQDPPSAPSNGGSEKKPEA